MQTAWIPARSHQAHCGRDDSGWRLLRCAPETATDAAGPALTPPSADLGSLWTFIDQEYALIDFADRSEETARAVHDSLMLHLCLRESPVTRPLCMSSLTAPGLEAACTFPGCTKKGCLGNSFRRSGDGPPTIVDIQHFKTAKSHGSYSLRIDPQGRTSKLLAAHSNWGRAMLLRADSASSPCLWVNSVGRPFASARSFGIYLPSLLKECVHVTWTRLR